MVLKLLALKVERAVVWMLEEVLDGDLRGGRFTGISALSNTESQFELFNTLCDRLYILVITLLEIPVTEPTVQLLLDESHNAPAATNRSCSGLPEGVDGTLSESLASISGPVKYFYILQPYLFYFCYAIVPVIRFVRNRHSL